MRKNSWVVPSTDGFCVILSTLVVLGWERTVAAVGERRVEEDPTIPMILIPLTLRRIGPPANEENAAAAVAAGALRDIWKIPIAVAKVMVAERRGPPETLPKRKLLTIWPKKLRKKYVFGFFLSISRVLFFYN